MAARRGSKTAEAPASVENATEESIVTETTEAVTETAPKAEAEPIDLTAFTAAVQAAVAEADVTTGDVPVISIEAVTVQYRALEGIKAKNAAKALVNEGMKDAMNSGNLAGARAYLSISEKALVAAAGGGGTKSHTPKDPTEAFVQRVATLNLAYNLATASVPEGIGEDWNEKVGALVTELAEAATGYLAWLNGDAETRGDEPEVASVVKNAAKLANGKAAKAGTSRVGGSFSGERHDVGAHIEAAFADAPEGTFLSIAAIRNAKSEEYGDALPSAGAVSARLFPSSGNSSMVKVGIQPTTQDGRKGAVKVAV